MARAHEYIRTTKKLGAQGQEKNVLFIVTVADQKKTVSNSKKWFLQ